MFGVFLFQEGLISAPKATFPELLCMSGTPQLQTFTAMQNSDPNAAVSMEMIFYFFRLRANTRPVAPIPINASVPGSGTAVMLPDGTPPLQAPGVRLHSGLSAIREVDTSNRSPEIMVFIITSLFKKVIYSFCTCRNVELPLYRGTGKQLVAAHKVLLRQFSENKCYLVVEPESGFQQSAPRGRSRRWLFIWLFNL